VSRRFLFGVLAVSLAQASAQVRLSGRVVDENSAIIAGAQVSIRLPSDLPDSRWTTVSDPSGHFSVELPAPGDYLISAERQGFFRLDNRAIHLGGPGEITLVLNTVREVFESIEVAYSPPAIDFDRTTAEERITGTQLLQVPHPSDNTLRNAFRAMPGMVQDSRGGVHLNGGTEEQVLYTLDGFQINDPLTGRFESRLGVEAVRSMEVSTLNPAEFGKGSAGVLAIKTSTGDDRWRYTGTNFLPGIENRKGLVIGGWTPRFGLSGPIRRSRAWFSDTLDVQYDKNIIEELPAGGDRSTSWRLSNLLRNQVNLSPRNVLYTGFLGSIWTAARNGLGVLDPVETTVDRRTRQWFFNVKDQVYFHNGALVEVGVAVNRTFGREIPQGRGMLIHTPDGRRGFSFLDATRTAGRDQLIANGFVPPFEALGSHQLKTGVDLGLVAYWQDVDRTGYEFVREDYRLARRVEFRGSGQLRVSNAEAAWFVQDSWRMRPGLLLELGLRADWDRLVGATNLSPRVGVAWAPPGLESTKVSAGYGVIYDQTNLRLFSRPLDQYALATYFRPDGDVDYGPALTVFRIGEGPLRTPRYRTLKLGFEHRFPAGLFGRFQYTRRRGAHGFSYVNALSSSYFPPSPYQASIWGASTFDAIYELANMRRDVYDGFEVTLRQAFRKQYEWLASYTRSRALSNSVVDISADDPLVVTNNVGRMPWDSPNRLVSWGYLPTFWDTWAIAYLLETRDGFPFSVHDDLGRLEGRVNERRFPLFFELNLFLERRFLFRKNKWAFRFGFNNITDHKNPNVVNTDTASSRFMTFYGGQSRALNFRLRWLGKN
jgi:hypothetical protein